MGEQAGQGTSQDQQGWNGDKIDVDQDSQKQGSGRDRGTNYQILDPGQQQFPFRGACVFLFTHSDVTPWGSGSRPPRRKI